MPLALYGQLADWYRLVDPAADHEEEAELYASAFHRAVLPPPETLLELGSGAGHNALFLKRWFRCTLVDLAPEMLALSRELNPECEHRLGDMRDVQVGQSFDAVLIHDAIAYLTTRADLEATIRNAVKHLRVGGALILAPDDLKETFAEGTRLESASEGERTLHNFMWDWDPDPDDDTCLTEFVITMRRGQDVRVVHERHVTGLFAEATWREVMERCGLAIELLPRSVETGETAHVFLGIKRQR